jgi:hypothetical protein
MKTENEQSENANTSSSEVVEKSESNSKLSETDSENKQIKHYYIKNKQ